MNLWLSLILQKLLKLLPQPDPRKDASVTSWCDLYSLDSLRLTLPLIIEDCQLKELVGE